MTLLERLYAKRPVRMVLIGVLSVLAAVSVYQGVANALRFSQDFQWDAAKALCVGLDPYDISLHPQKAVADPELERFYAMFTDRGLKQKMEANQFPSLLLLLAPMTVFPPETARIIWCILNLLFTAGIVVLLRRTFFEKSGAFEFALMVLVTLAGTPYRNQLGVGQHTLFAFFFFMAALWLDVKKPLVPVANSISIAFCLFVSFFKYTLTAPLALFFVYRKRYREPAAAVIAHILLTMMCALHLGKSLEYMIKAPLTVASALVAEGGIDLGVIFGGVTGSAFAALIGVILVFMALRLPKRRERMLFAVLILWSLVLTYHRTYDFFVLSAVPMMFGDRAFDEGHEMSGRVLKIWYGILLAFIFFGLRIFNENTSSKICAGIIYYAFTLCVTYMALRMIGKKHE